MSRGRVPSLLSVNSGKPKKAVVKRQSSCRRCKEIINVGDFCVEIPKRNGYTSYHRYCSNCFKEIMKKTRTDLDKIEEDILS